jgi:hypothetical protein
VDVRPDGGIAIEIFISFRIPEPTALTPY